MKERDEWLNCLDGMKLGKRAPCMDGSVSFRSRSVMQIDARGHLDQISDVFWSEAEADIIVPALGAKERRAKSKQTTDGRGIHKNLNSWVDGYA